MSKKNRFKGGRKDAGPGTYQPVAHTADTAFRETQDEAYDAGPANANKARDDQTEDQQAPRAWERYYDALARYDEESADEGERKLLSELKALAEQTEFEPSGRRPPKGKNGGRGDQLAAVDVALRSLRRTAEMAEEILRERRAALREMAKVDARIARTQAQTTRTLQQLLKG